MSRDKDYLDQALAFGAGFDWITPVMSLFFRKRGYEHAAVDVDWLPYVKAAARDMGIKLINQMIVGDRFVFDVKPRDWKRIERYLGRRR